MLVDANTLSNDFLSRHILISSISPLFGIPLDAQPSPEFIKGSRPFDIEAQSDQDAPNPHTLASPEQGQRQLRKLGINNDSSILVYDQFGIYSAPRTWFNFRLMGCSDVALINGGLPAMKDAGYTSVANIEEDFIEGDFRTHYNQNMLADVEYVLKAIDDPTIEVVDVRSAGRFNGLEPEPRPGLRSGHIPGSVNIPFSVFLNQTYYLDVPALKQVFRDSGCGDPEKELVFSCGSGVTACIGYLAAHICGYRKIRVYDGSWAEWGANDELPIEC